MRIYIDSDDIPPPSRLRLLAAVIDREDQRTFELTGKMPEDGVQRDLRRWADNIEKSINAAIAQSN